VSDDGGVAFLFSVVGRGTEWLAERKPEETLDLLGPLGNGFRVDEDAGDLLLVAGGIGIAPLVALADWAAWDGRSVTLLMGCAAATSVYPRDLLPHGIRVVVSTEDCSLGEGGMVTDLLPTFAPHADRVFACGPLPMYRRMAEMRDVLGGRPTQVLLETLLGCGVGACLGCSIETVHGRRLVCKDGPVFDLDEIVWNKMVEPPCGRLHLAL
jgi:dihydroorotate dehydrogenase electron transfer subunit